MVRKVITILTLALVIITTCSLTTNAAEVYDGSISSSYTQYARDLISKIRFNDDYLFYRSGQYTYEFVYGDLNFVGGKFTGTDLNCFILSYGSNISNNTPTISENEIDTFSLIPNNKVVYSNLGHFPSLVERGSVYETLETFILVVMCLCFFIRFIFFRR